MKSIKELSDLIHLEKIDDSIYRGQNYQSPWGSVFGGQVMAQAAHAARRTVPEDRLLHSLHGYFILRGDLLVPIVFKVDKIRDGRSFTTRRVVATQNGKAIFNLSASFQIAEEGFEHQIAMPNVPSPDALITDKEWAAKYEKSHPKLYERAMREDPLEFKQVERFDPINLRNERPVRHLWMKAKGTILEDQMLQREILTYASDYRLMSTSMLPHRTKQEWKDMQFASLDHAMWFYHDININEWLLCAFDSPVASNSRGLNRANFFTQDGKLVASVAQEGLIRHRGVQN